MKKIQRAIQLVLTAAPCLFVIQAQAVDIDDIQTDIFDGSCAVSGCHNGSIGPNLSPGVAFDNIVNISSGNFGLDYIEPGDPANSYLLRKVDTSVGTISGGVMPPGRPALSQSQIDLLTDWINDGAPEDDQCPVNDRCIECLQNAWRSIWRKFKTKTGCLATKHRVGEQPR